MGINPIEVLGRMLAAHCGLTDEALDCSTSKLRAGNYEIRTEKGSGVFS